MCLRNVFFILSLTSTICLQGQIQIIGKILDAKTKEPLIFCHLINVSTSESFLSNDEGVYKIQSVLPKDTIEISYLGYETFRFLGAELKKNPTVHLEPKGVLIDEVKIVANDHYLIEMVKKCSEVSKKAVSTSSKAYLEVNSDDSYGPLELLQLYYNATAKGPKLGKLDFKNGKVAMIKDYTRYFVSLGTSKALLLLDVLDQNDHYPDGPLAMSKKNIKKHFWLTKNDEVKDQDVLCIFFEPKKDKDEYFKGEIWMRKSDQKLIKLVLKVDNTKKHPFSPFRKEDKILDLGFDITFHFKENDLSMSMSLLEFKTTFGYLDQRSAIPELRQLTIKGILHFYDYSQLFILPMFKYNAELNDYRKAAIIPYDSTFWAHHQGLEMTKDQKQRMDLFERNGFSLNFKVTDGVSKKNEKDYLENGTFFEYNNVAWQKNKVIKLAKKTSETGIQMARFKVQLFLDVHFYEGRPYYNSSTIFDIFETKYLLEMNKENLVFLNIYFDLCEMQRQKMLEALKNARDIHEIEVIHQKMTLEMKETTQAFQNEVDFGNNPNEIRKWNDLVKSNLGKDNMSIFANWKP